MDDWTLGYIKSWFTINELAFEYSLFCLTKKS